MKSAVFGIVSSPLRAESIIEELHLTGFSNKDVSLLFPDKEGAREAVHIKSTKVTGGAIAGVIIGAVLGGIVGCLAGAGIFVIQNAEPWILVGPFYAGLSGVAVGATACGLGGALIGLCFHQYEAKIYPGKLEDGNILIAAHARNNEEITIAREILERANAHDISVAPEPALHD